MKKTFTTIAMTLATLCAMAVPAKRGQWKTVTLADGTKVRVELRGDEFINYWQAEDGRRFVRNAATAKYELADMTKLRERAQALRKSINIKGGKQNAPVRSATRAASSQYTGDKKGLVILVEFPDKQFTHGNRNLYEKILNEKNYSNPDLGFVGSVSDYFREQSKGVFNLTFDVVGPVMMSKESTYYGGDTPYQDANIREMLLEALNTASTDVDFSKYDWNNDNEVEQVFFIYAGLGQANGGGDNTIWPHKSILNTQGGITLDGIRINTYACSCECQPVYTQQGKDIVMTGTMIDGIGTICHEFSHCLGLADLYDISGNTGNGGGYGMDAWDLMSSGSYNDNGFRPACYTGAEQMWIGWKQPIELTEATEIKGMKSLENGGESYIIRNDANPDEYYILDNRQPDGRWDAGLPGAGLLITHVDYDQGVWDSNGPNDNPNHQRCTPIPADGNFYTYTENIAGDAYPYGSNNSLTNETTPAAKVYAKNTDGTYYMNKPITDITQNADGTISFSFGVQEGPLFYESFDKCIGKGGNDDDESLKGFVPDANNKLGQGELLTDNEGWAYSGEKGGAYNCAMFESPATTPEFEIDGKCTLTFRAGAIWDNKYTGNSAINLAVTGNAKLGTSQVEMVEYGFGDHSVDITGTGKIKITFSSDATFVLDEVKVMSATATGIDGITVQPDAAGKPADRRIYSIDGRYVGTDATQLPKGMYIRGGKKFIKR